MKIIFVDKNISLYKKVWWAKRSHKLPIEVHLGDIFKYSGQIVSASNPRFTMGAGTYMSERLHRRGCEFSRCVKEQVYKRSKGKCEYPEGCDNPNNGRVDHITSCFIGKQLGMSKQALSSIDNAQMLCNFHDGEKTLILEPAAIDANDHRILTGSLQFGGSV